MGSMHIITGDAGSGKSTLVYKRIYDATERGTRAYLVVPEQETVWCERTLTELLPSSYPLTFEVTNFTRLSDTVSRSLGRICYDHASEGARALMMWHTLDMLSDHISDGACLSSDLGRVGKMLSAVRELDAAGVDARSLGDAAESLPEDSNLKRRLSDLSLITALYKSLFEEKFKDGGDELIKLWNMLRDGNFFNGAEIYIDGFTSFTQIQSLIVTEMAAECDVTVTLPLPDGREEEVCFAEIKDTMARLIRSASKAKIPVSCESAGKCKRQKSAMLDIASQNLWGSAEPPRYVEATDGCITVIEATDAYDEAEFCAADISKRVREGYMYRDFAIVSGDISKYDGIIDSVLDAHGIPHFTAASTDVASFRPIKLICSAYAAICSSFSRRDVITYTKCGLLGVEENLVDEFEFYTERWGISGKRFTDGNDWNMNPDGYREELSDTAKDELVRINDTRHKLCDPLIAFFDECRGKHTVKEHSVALYRFITEISLADRLKESARAARDAGDLETADAEERLFGIICDTLDKITKILPDMLLLPEEYLAILKLMFSEENISNIPTSCDEVTLGSAATLRANSPRHVYLIGVSDGSFPAMPVSSCYFSHDELRRLEEIGINIGEDEAICGARELFHFYRAFRAASESVTLIRPSLDTQMKPSERSAVTGRLKSMFGGDIEKSTSNIPIADKVWRADDIPRAVADVKDDKIRASLICAAKSDERVLRTINSLSIPISNTDAKASRGAATDITGGILSLSQSKIDTYAKCPLAYFCKYILKLNDGKKFEFDFSDMGNFSHAIIERLFRTVKEQGKDFGELSDETLRALVDELTESYIDVLLYDKSLRTPRREHLFKRLRRAVYEVAKYMRDEFAQSSFKAEFFEFGMGMGKDGMPAKQFHLSDGLIVLLRGKIDRIDILHRDGVAYLRVVDYKSSVRKFDIDSLSRGLGAQLMVYLLSVTGEESPIPQMLSVDEVRAAGAMYMKVTPKRIELMPGENEQTYEDEIKESFTSSGIFIDDAEILRAMDKELSGRYIPITESKGVFTSASIRSLASAEKLGELMITVEKALCNIGEDIRSGRACATPSSNKADSACTFCAMAAICRSVKK